MPIPARIPTPREQAGIGVPADAPATEVGIALLVAHDTTTRDSMFHLLSAFFASIETAASRQDAMRLAGTRRIDLVAICLCTRSVRAGAALAQELRTVGDRHPRILFIAEPNLQPHGLGALAGSDGVMLTKPFTHDQLARVIEHRLPDARLARESVELERGNPAGDQEAYAPALGPSTGIVGDSADVKQVLHTIASIAPKPSTVLVKGETGTGKELVARALHELSGRSGQFVPINCGAISPELIEGELFGHVRGAFTGAHQQRDGLFKLADGGTLFLDEIGEMPLALQAKLLRVLEDRRFRPVGGNVERPVDTRVVAATNRDLLEEVERGRFREDLYYRINVVDIQLPPLRERRRDILLLARFFNESLAAQLGVEPLALSPQDLHELVLHDWPGNCRELRNLIERSLLLGQSPSECCPALGRDRRETDDAPSRLPRSPRAGASLKELERDHILNALLAAQGNKTLAARHLGISRKTIERKLKGWGEF